MELALIVICIVYVATVLLDSMVSVDGIKIGLAVEGNSLLVWMAGTNKPPVRWYVIYGLLEILVVSSLGWVGLGLHNLSLEIAGLAPMGVMAVKHLIAVREWIDVGVKL